MYKKMTALFIYIYNPTPPHIYSIVLSFHWRYWRCSREYRQLPQGSHHCYSINMIHIVNRAYQTTTTRWPSFDSINFIVVVKDMINVANGATMDNHHYQMASLSLIINLILSWWRIRRNSDQLLTSWRWAATVGSWLGDKGMGVNSQD